MWAPCPQRGGEGAASAQAEGRKPTTGKSWGRTEGVSVRALGQAAGGSLIQQALPEALRVLGHSREVAERWLRPLGLPP